MDLKNVRLSDMVMPVITLSKDALVNIQPWLKYKTLANQILASQDGIFNNEVVEMAVFGSSRNK